MQAESDLARARQLALSGDWPGALRAYEGVAAEAERASDRNLALQCWLLAGDAARRDDRPARAARALQRAVAAMGDEHPERRAIAEVQLGATLLEAGDLDAAEGLVQTALGRAAEPGVRTVALDTLVGVRVARGRVPEAHTALAQLTQVAPPAAQSAVWFRRGLLARLSGDLAGARAGYQRARDLVAGGQDLAGPEAAATAVMAELALLEGTPERALTLFDQASRLWSDAGRRAGLFRAEAGSVRAELALGRVPLASSLVRAIDWAVDRQMALLEVELRMVRGAALARAVVRGADDQLDQAVGLAHACGAVLLEGQARVTRRRCGILRKEDEARARACLEHDVVWTRAIGGEVPWW